MGNCLTEISAVWAYNPILLNQVGKDLREIQELLRHKNIRTTVRYTHVGYEQTRQTAEALSQALE